ncbi:MAG: hypothetical protein JWN15_2181 [Firmicutes bacterium]|nr:hypothetical protein [Bacillota bacterium]
MSEHFDTELARAVKESAAKSLKGWEFTPAMQRSVLERIEHAATGIVPGARPSRRFDPMRAVRPLAWTAVAAATLLVVVNTRVGERGLIRKSVPDAGTAQSAPAAPVAKAIDPAGNGPQPSATPPTANGPGNAPEGTQGASPGSTGSGGPATQQGTAQPDQRAESNSPAQPKQPHLFSQPAGGAGTTTPPTAPDQMGFATVPGESDPKAPQALSGAYGGDKVALEVPPQAPRGNQNPPAGVPATAPSDTLHVVAVGSRVVELSRSGVRVIAADGAQAWAYPLTGAADTSLLAVAGDGSVAVTIADKVHVLSPDGKLLRVLEPAGNVTALAWGTGGRLAIAAGSVVTVIRPATATAEFHTEVIGQPELSFSPDGTLAVLGEGKSGRQLLIYGKGGALAAQVQQGRSNGRGLVFTPGAVVAGSQAYGLLGRPLWQTPFVPEGLALAGTDLIMARKADAVVALRAADGVAVWQATWSGSGQGLRRVVTAPDGRFVSVLGSTGDGWVYWVLDHKGKVLYAERLPEEPSDMAFVGERLMLLMSSGPEFRAFPH